MAQNETKTDSGSASWKGMRAEHRTMWALVRDTMILMNGGGQLHLYPSREEAERANHEGDEVYELSVELEWIKKRV